MSSQRLVRIVVDESCRVCGVATGRDRIVTIELPVELSRLARAEVEAALVGVSASYTLTVDSAGYNLTRMNRDSTGFDS